MRKSSSSGQIVKLNVYDLGQHNEYLYDLGLGTFHSGVEFSGQEYTFASGSGVFSHEPKLVPGHAKFRETIELGTYLGTARDYERILDSLKEEFLGNTYNILTRNCNHFANALVTKLLNKPIPGYVNRLANLGGMVSCLFPPQLLSDAPVDQQQSGSSSGSTSGYQVIVPRNREKVAVKSDPIAPLNPHPPSNTGMVLGGSSETNPSQLGIHERREKARQAALKRMSKQES